MKKAGKKLFQSLGALRDVQIMMEWIDTLDFAPLQQTPTSAAPERSRRTRPNPPGKAKPRRCCKFCETARASTSAKLARPSRSSIASSGGNGAGCFQLEQPASPGQRGFQAPGPGAVERRPPVAYPRHADAIGGRASHPAHRDQTIPLHCRKLSAARAPGMGKRSEAPPGPAWGSTRLGRALGNGGGGGHLQ